MPIIKNLFTEKIENSVYSVQLKHKESETELAVLSSSDIDNLDHNRIMFHYHHNAHYMSIVAGKFRDFKISEIGIYAISKQELTAIIKGLEKLKDIMR
jgi:hypothetical protein